MYCPLPQAIQPCPNCGELFATQADNSPVWSFGPGLRRSSYKPKPVEFTAKSPLAEAFIRLQSAVKNYAHEGIWTDDEFLEEIEGLLSVQIQNNRETPDAKPVEPRYTRKTTSRVPRSRKGWMDCPNCLSSIELFVGEKPECVECDWKAQDAYQSD